MEKQSKVVYWVTNSTISGRHHMTDVLALLINTHAQIDQRYTGQEHVHEVKVCIRTVLKFDIREMGAYF